MREHQYSFEMPHAAARIWALLQDSDRWTDDAPMVKRVDVLWPGNDQIGPNRTRFHFDERYNIKNPPFKWFEGVIYKFINKKNEESMRSASAWLGAHPEYRPDLVEHDTASTPADGG